ncbi:MAG: hypothetical protein ACREBK_00245 [Sphingomicrobium sp.]
MLLLANAAPFLFGLLMVGLTWEYQASDFAHWDLENYLGFVIAAYLPLALAAFAVLQLNGVPNDVRRIGQQVLSAWGAINLIVFAGYLLTVWRYL